MSPTSRPAARPHAARRPATRRLGALLAAAVLAGLVGHPAGAAPEGTAAGAGVTGPARRAAAGAQVNGTGSSYVGLAMQQWTAEAQTSGLQVNYTPSGSPDGLSRFAGGQVDFAGTEAEFASLGTTGNVARGYQYVPDVGGAIAVMYNVKDLSGRKVDYLHLSRSTVAKIFLGEISRWNDPAIAADNTPANLRLPDEPINVVYRGGQSGTTALFYDFIRETEPDRYRAWAARNRLPNGRIVELDSAPGFAPKTQALASSEQIAQYVAGNQGAWSIAYDEFGYAKTYRATSAWIDNSGGKWTLPYAANISAALESAKLRPDLSQELSGVYRSANPLTYPISAYSYLVTQCEPSGDRPTCRGPYANPGVTETLAGWMRYIACEGQVRMAAIGYSPLPPNLSQEIANSISRMAGGGVERLSAANCANPRFRGSLGAESQGPPDPYEGLPPGGGGAGGGPGGGAAGPGAGAGEGEGPGGAGAGEGPAGSGAEDADGDGVPDAAEDADGAADEQAVAAAGKAGGSTAVGGGSGTWRNAAPVAYDRRSAAGSRWPWVVLVLAIVIPALGTPLLRRLRPARTASGRRGGRR